MSVTEISLHREHCSCAGAGVDCDLDVSDLTEAELDRAYHDSFVWPIGAGR